MPPAFWRRSNEVEKEEVHVGNIPQGRDADAGESGE